jgi:catechol 2,3-dioxygenase-like lactoylglutathione lyase family enzyme
VSFAGSVTPLSTAVPILPSEDLDRSRAFYSFLGFRVLSQSPDYLRIALDSVQLHLYLMSGTDPRTNPEGWYLCTAQPEELREKWCADGVDCPAAQVPAEYGSTVFALVDPDGNMLRVGPLPH